jgi:tRNA-binding protein
MELISWQDFTKVELRVGRIISAELFPQAKKPAYLLQVDFGAQLGTKRSSAQITEHYQPEQLIGKLVLGVVNFPKKQIGPVQSECLITGFHDAAGKVILCVPDADIPLGSKLL